MSSLPIGFFRVSMYWAFSSGSSARGGVGAGHVRDRAVQAGMEMVFWPLDLRPEQRVHNGELN